MRESEAREPELHSLLQGPASQSSQEAPPTRQLRNIAGLLFKVNKTNNRKYFNYIYLCICVYALVCGVCVRPCGHALLHLHLYKYFEACMWRVEVNLWEPALRTELGAAGSAAGSFTH